jgi:hypothetical protein
MTDTKLLVGSLSNDLFRVASLWQSGSKVAAARFLLEAKTWAKPLTTSNEKPYIKKIADSVMNHSAEGLNLAVAEELIMFSVLLQNHALQMDKAKF